MSRAPDYNVGMQRKRGDDYGYSRRIGAAWVNKKGGINVSIDLPLTITDPDEWSIVLWPNDNQGGGRQGGGRSTAPANSPPAAQDEFGDDDIPF